VIYEVNLWRFIDDFISSIELLLQNPYSLIFFREIILLILFDFFLLRFLSLIIPIFIPLIFVWGHELLLEIDNEENIVKEI